MSGLFKAAVFGFIVTFIGCFFGFKTSGGASGVGVAATQSVVSSSILILGTRFDLGSSQSNSFGVYQPRYSSA